MRYLSYVIRDETICVYASGYGNVGQNKSSIEINRKCACVEPGTRGSKFKRDKKNCQQNNARMSKKTCKLKGENLGDGHK